MTAETVSICIVIRSVLSKKNKFNSFRNVKVEGETRTAFSSSVKFRHIVATVVQ